MKKIVIIESKENMKTEVFIDFEKLFSIV